MKALLMKLLRRAAEPAPAPTQSKPTAKRKLRTKPRHYAGPGARRIDPNSNLLEQARQAGGITR